jgi:hypothetical protein
MFFGTVVVFLCEKSEDAKEGIRSRHSKKDRQYNDQRPLICKGANVTIGVLL